MEHPFSAANRRFFVVRKKNYALKTEAQGIPWQVQFPTADGWWDYSTNTPALNLRPMSLHRIMWICSTSQTPVSFALGTVHSLRASGVLSAASPGCHCGNQRRQSVLSMATPSWDRREGARAQPLNEWHGCRCFAINWLELTRSKMAEDSTPSGPWASLHAHCNTLAARWHTHRHHDSSQPDCKRPKSRWDPVPRNPCRFPKRVGITLPLVSKWNYPAHKS